MSQIVEDIINEINEVQIDEGDKLMLYEMRPILEKHIAKVERPTGQWIQLKDNVNHFYCSVCDTADYYEDWTPKFCPECGAQMQGTVANKCGSCIHDKEKSEPRTCPKCRVFDRYEPMRASEND